MRLVEPKQVFSKVLILEDEEAHSALILRELKNLVGEVSLASTLTEGLELLKTEYYELVLCDLHLPEYSGIHVIESVLNLRPGIPVVVMTSSNNLEDAVSAMRAGAYDYMVKEFSKDFSRRLSILINRTALRRVKELEEQSLRSERHAFWAAAESAQDGLAILGERGEIVFSNQTFASLFKMIRQEEINGSSIFQMLEKCDASVAEVAHRKLQAETENNLWTTEFSFLPTEKLNGSGDSEHEKHYQLTLSSITLGELQSLGISDVSVPFMKRSVVWIRDITERKSREKFQRDLISTTTHDLKGPLGAILTSAEMLQEREFAADKQEKIFTRMASCARKAITIIDELLSARRIQDGLLTISPHRYRVGEIIEDVYYDFLPMAQNRETKLSRDIESADHEIYADRLGVSRVITNLVSNALKFTPKGGEVSMSSFRSEKGVTIEIKDTGCGIEPAVSRTLFEKYARLSKHHEIEGTGLGLYITKNIVDAHGGRIEIASEVGKGTTFSVFFPNEAESTRQEAQEATGSKATGSKEVPEESVNPS